jgi:hypothetical protein
MITLQVYSRRMYSCPLPAKTCFVSVSEACETETEKRVAGRIYEKARFREKSGCKSKNKI